MLNPDWEVRLYDEATIRRYVADQFPQHMDVFEQLVSDVERSNLFRYAPGGRVGSVSLGHIMHVLGCSKTTPTTKLLVSSLYPR